MNAIQAIILGLIQGATEFLPVSSSAHLLILPSLFGWKPQSIDFDIILHSATLLAVIIYFRKELMEIVQGLFTEEPEVRKKYTRLVTGLIIAVIPIIPFMLLFKSFIDYSEQSVIITLVLLIIFGIPFLFIEDRYIKNSKIMYSLSWKQSLGIGVSQCFALFSGISRSGITILSGMITGLTKDEAKRFTFLLSIPTIAGSFLLEILKVYKNFTFPEGSLNVALGFIAAFISGIFAINIMMEILKTKTLKVFGWYRIIAGIIFLLYFLIK